ncbi:hypothetical protein [Spongiactinospora sp. 9N601]|uniref:hypothetical protein n=1 Tax=Spongiactinospora sp. 9N601 TaxID=3375149 RepID=UPI0037B76AA4
MLANATFDLGEVQPAYRHARTAMQFGDLSEHRGLRIWVSGLQALIAFWDGHPDQSVAFVQPVLDWSAEGGTAAVYTHAVHARALAMLGHAREADDALARTDQQRERVVQIDSPVDNPEGLFDFPMAKQLYWKAGSHLLIGSPQRLTWAHEAAVESIRRYLEAPSGKARTGKLCHARLDLASARWRQGHPEGAEGEIAQVITTLRNRYVESVTRRVERFGVLVRSQPKGQASRQILGAWEARASRREECARESEDLPVAPCTTMRTRLL